MEWIYVSVVCSFFGFGCSEAREKMSEMQCREMLKSGREYKTYEGGWRRGQACLSPAGEWVPGKIGEPV